MTDTVEPNERTGAPRARPERGAPPEASLAEALLRASLDPIVAIDERGTVLSTSDSVETVFGWSRADLVGENVKVLMIEPYRSEHDDYLLKYLRTGEINILGRTREFPMRHRDGRELVCELSVARAELGAGRPQVFIGCLRDITERRRSERAERNMLRALASVGESAAILAHEIKNPITAVNVALRAVAHQLGEDERSVLEDLSARMQRLEGFMRRTLSFARPLSLDIAQVEVRELVAHGLAGLEPLIAARGATIESEAGGADLRVNVDRGLLESALVNLVENAIDAAGRGGHVRITAHRVEPDTLELRVEDDGPGLPEGRTEELFQPFASLKETGTGLGLPFSRKVVREHDGELVAGASELGGACFVIRLPLDHH